MKQRQYIHPDSLDEANAFFHAKHDGETVYLQFEDNILFHTINLGYRDMLHDWLGRLAENRLAKVLVIRQDLQKTDVSSYMHFFRMICTGWEKKEIRRFSNVINQFLILITELPQMVIHVDSGRVISLFFNISLACDYRIVTEDTIFENPFSDAGILPKGGGCFFLPRMIGRAKTFELLLLHHEFSAQKAYDIGVVDMLLPEKNLESAVMETAERFARNSRKTIAGIKRLVNYSEKALSDYLEYENSEIFRIVDSVDFLRSMQYHGIS